MAAWCESCFHFSILLFVLVLRSILLCVCKLCCCCCFKSCNFTTHMDLVGFNFRLHFFSFTHVTVQIQCRARLDLSEQQQTICCNEWCLCRYLLCASVILQTFQLLSVSMPCTLYTMRTHSFLCRYRVVFFFFKRGRSHIELILTAKTMVSVSAAAANA